MLGALAFAVANTLAARSTSSSKFDLLSDGAELSVEGVLFGVRIFHREDLQETLSPAARAVNMNVLDTEGIHSHPDWIAFENFLLTIGIDTNGITSSDGFTPSWLCGEGCRNDRRSP